MNRKSSKIHVSPGAVRTVVSMAKAQDDYFRDDQLVSAVATQSD